MIGEAPDIEYRRHSGEQSDELVDQLAAVFAEVYAERPYDFGSDEVSLFRDRFDVQRQQDGFSLVTTFRTGTRRIRVRRDSVANNRMVEPAADTRTGGDV